jgi:hypothetical protein
MILKLRAWVVRPERRLREALSPGRYFAGAIDTGRGARERTACPVTARSRWDERVTAVRESISWRAWDASFVEEFSLSNEQGLRCEDHNLEWI